MDGVGGVEVYDAVVVDVDGGDAVGGGGEEEGVVEAGFVGAGLDFGVPVDVAVAEADVPFAYEAGGVAGGF